MKKLIFLPILILLMFSCEEPNTAPNIVNLIASAQTVESEGTLMLSCEAQDPDGDPIMYRWSCISGTFLSGTSSSTVMWKAPHTNSETISKITVQIADAEHPFDGPFMDSRAIIIMVDPAAPSCVKENYGTMIIKNTNTYAIRVYCSREDPSCPQCVTIDPTPVVALAPNQSTTFNIKPGNIVAWCISEANWQLGLGGPWTTTIPFPLTQCEIRTLNWGPGK